MDFLDDKSTPQQNILALKIFMVNDYAYPTNFLFEVFVHVEVPLVNVMFHITTRKVHVHVEFFIFSQKVTDIVFLYDPISCML